ncbi:hypothetical protein EAO69_29035 [Streptomyces sp. me109]|nr:hypothetical protein EAO69_29035 [Streptomyces sp. me109]
MLRGRCRGGPVPACGAPRAPWRAHRQGPGREPRAESREPRAESREPRAESREPLHRPRVPQHPQTPPRRSLPVPIKAVHRAVRRTVMKRSR